MAKDTNVKIIALAMLSALMLVLSYLFFRIDGYPIALILLFIGLVLALILASRNKNT